MNLRELYNFIEMLPEAGMNYIASRMVPPNELTKDERKTLASWITKNTRSDFIPAMKDILFMLDIDNLRWVSNPTEDECLKAIYSDPYLIEHIDGPNENVQLAAMHHPRASLARIFNLIKNPVKATWISILSDDPGIILNMKDPEVDYQMVSIDKRPELILNSTVAWTPEVRRIAFQKDSRYFPALKNPTADECWTALHFDHTMIRYIPDPLPEMKAFSILVS